MAQGVPQVPFVLEGLIVLILGTVLVWTLPKAWKYFSKPRQASVLRGSGKESREVISFTTGLYIFAYLASIVPSMTMFDASTKFKLRILCAGVCWLVDIAGCVRHLDEEKLSPACGRSTILALGLSIYKQSVTFAHWSQGGLGYASLQWYDSDAMAYLRDLPADVSIYTNQPAAVYIYVGRGAKVLPSRYDSATAQERTGYEESLLVVQTDVLQGRAVMALFDGNNNIPGDVELMAENLHLGYKGQGDAVYIAKP